jgi:hypothetical protein
MKPLIGPRLGCKVWAVMARGTWTLTLYVMLSLAVGVMMVLWVLALLFALPCQGPSLGRSLSPSRLLFHRRRRHRQHRLRAVRAVAVVLLQVGLLNLSRSLGLVQGTLRGAAQGCQRWCSGNRLIARLGFERCCPPSKAAR